MRDAPAHRISAPERCGRETAVAYFRACVKDAAIMGGLPLMAALGAVAFVLILLAVACQGRNGSREPQRLEPACGFLPGVSKSGPQAAWFDVRPSIVQGAGRGVFSRRAFEPGEIVMQAPILRYPRGEVSPDGVLARYQGGDGDMAFLCFDYQGLVNTAPAAHENNVRAEWRIMEGLSQFVATKAIAPGHELFQNYDAPTRLN